MWWVIRPSLHYPTLELRIADACTNPADTIALASLYRALVAFLVRHPQHGRDWSAITRRIVDENRWRAKRYGTRAKFIDDRTAEVTSVADAYRQLRELIDEDVRDLGCEAALERVERVLARGTSADRQIELYVEKRLAGADRITALKAVVDWLAEETIAPIDEAPAGGV